MIKLFEALKKNPIIWITILGLLLRLIVVAFSSQIMDEVIIDRYDIIAENIITGHGFSYQIGKDVPTVTRAPYYPIYLALIFSILGKNFIILRTLEALVDSAVVVILYYWLKQNFRPREGNLTKNNIIYSQNYIPELASLIYAIQPFSIYYAIKLGPETGFTFWLLFSVYIFSLTIKSKHPTKYLILLSLSQAILILNKSVALFLPFIWVAFEILFEKINKQLVWKMILTTLSVFLFISPWSIRNYHVTNGEFVPIQTLTWWNFWYDFGVKPDNLSQDIVSNLYPEYGGHPYGLNALSDVKQEKYFSNLALSWILANPISFLNKIINNISEFWTFAETSRKTLFILMYQLIQLPFVVLGLIIGFRSSYKNLVLLSSITVIYFVLIYSPIMAVFRYSLVTIPFISFFIAISIDWIYKKFHPISLNKQL